MMDVEELIDWFRTEEMTRRGDEAYYYPMGQRKLLREFIVKVLAQDRQERGFTCDSCGKECSMKGGKLYCDKCLVKTVVESGIEAAEKEDSTP